ncbi:glutamine-dependent NAD(+) synthetase [Spirochaetota bacterium]|nr:glutamine-dependent NAD(+) synthetase [Spirochaetota bacterium]
MKVTIVEFNPKVADLVNNTRRIRSYIDRYDEKDHLLVFPELALTGYSPLDLLIAPSFLQRVQTCTLEIARTVKKGTVLLGAPFLENKTNSLYNAVLVLSDRQIKTHIVKTLLPNDDIFDEERYFTAGTPTKTSNIVTISGYKWFVLICKDLWGAEILPPIPRARRNRKTGLISKSAAIPCWRSQLSKSNPIAAVSDHFDGIIVPSASPFTRDKLEKRLHLARLLVQSHSKPLIYVNQCGANDEILYDGRSFIIDASNKVQHVFPGFHETTQTFLVTPVRNNKKSPSKSPSKSFQLTLTPSEHPPPLNSPDITLTKYDDSQANTPSSRLKPKLKPKPKWLPLHDIAWNKSNQNETEYEAILRALVMGVSDYARKTGFTKAVLGVSGGIDSALTLVIGALALGADNILAIALPSPYSSKTSITDAKALAVSLGVRFQKIPITAPFTTLKPILTAGFDEFARASHSNKTSRRKAMHTITEQNLQARLRALILMAYSNETGSLLLATGNKSEIAVGYTTLYGDLAGSLAVIGDLFKTEVYHLAHFINNRYAPTTKPLIPKSILTKEPSAELKPNQKDTDTLPPYLVLDDLLKKYLLLGYDEAKLIRCGFKRSLIQTVLPLIRNSEYKRFQAPPVLKVSNRSFGRGRRIPIVKS